MKKTEKEHMFNRIKTLYGARLTPDQLDAVEASMENVVKVLEDLRSVPLENSDEPFTVFKPYRKDRR